ncbi:hypothetical protein EK21DRAFT_109269 [Setomelanomma holmii]|uniref:Uncharacterized protein n=1 Tax=Setomelanomma holmii TaxID=210430 RepID=A0A9P4HE45_9PLEO|nr:hypothetical protein EK21DRAFT_109269 [Setomelanomma holmii]
MAKLEELEFDRVGTLNLDGDPENPTVGPTYHWKPVSDLVKLTDEDMSTPACIKCVPPFSSASAYFQTALDEHWPRDENPEIHINNGRRRIVSTLLASAPFNKSIKTGD